MVIFEEAAPTRSTGSKLLPTLGREGGRNHIKERDMPEKKPIDSNSNNMGMYKSHLTTSVSDTEEKARSRTSSYDSEQEHYHTLQQRRAELLSNVLHDSIKLLIPPALPAQIAEQAPLVRPTKKPLSRLMNKLKDFDMKTIFEE